MAIGGMIIGKNFVTLMLNGRTETITDSHPNYERIREAVKVKDMDLVESLVNVAKQVTNWMVGKVHINNGQVFYNEQLIHGALVDRILAMIEEGFDANPMIRFLDNLMQNPSKRAVDELYGFLECTSLPITEDGHFLAYKKVREDYRDFYTGKMDNSVGQTLEMPRNSVDEDKDRTCSTGLHFCSLSYLSQYYGSQGRVVILKINPRDVVAIPSDYNNAKGRACRYEVIGDHTSECEEAFNSPVYSNKFFEDLADSYDTDNAEDDEENGWDEQSAYDSGWGVGYANYEDGEPYDTTLPSDLPTWYAADYARGYQEGYEDAARDLDGVVDPIIDTPKDSVAPVSGGLVGYNQGRKDAAAGVPYNDDPRAHALVVNDVDSYKKGYAKGWDSIKLG